MVALLEFLFSPRLWLALIGGAVIWWGGHLFGEVRRDDAPLRRALGPAGIPVEATVRSRPISDEFRTTLRYEHQGQNYRTEVLLRGPERKVPEGGRIACRLDPENPRFLALASADVPSTKLKLVPCLLVIGLGALIGLASLAPGLNT